MSRFPRRRCTTSVAYIRKKANAIKRSLRISLSQTNERRKGGTRERTFRIFLLDPAIAHEQIYIYFVWAKTKYSCLKDFNDQAELSNLSSPTVPSFFLCFEIII